MIYSKWGNMRYKYRNREFWCRGYYVDTVGKNTKKIKEYIANQLKEDKISDQMTIEEIDPKGVATDGCKSQSQRPLQWRPVEKPFRRKGKTTSYAGGNLFL